MLRALVLFAIRPNVASELWSSIAKSIAENRGSSCTTYLITNPNISTFHWDLLKEEATCDLMPTPLILLSGDDTNRGPPWKGTGRETCSTVIGDTSEIRNFTALEHRFSRLANVTFWLYLDSDEEFVGVSRLVPKYATLIYLLEINGTFQAHKSCPVKGYQGIINIWKNEFMLHFDSFECSYLLNGQHIVVSGPNGGFLPYVKYNTQNQFVGGVEIDLISDASKVLNFSFEIRNVGAWVSMYPGGGWGGVVGQVKNGTATLGIGHFLMSSLNYQAIDYLYYTFAIDVIIVGPYPRPLLPVFRMIKPFGKQVWIALVVTILAVTTIAVIVGISSPKHSKSGTSHSKSELVLHSVLEVTRICLSQNQHKVTKSRPLSEVVLHSFWTVADFGVKALFCALLLVHLLKAEYEQPIDTVEDILLQGSHLWVGAGTQMRNILAQSSRSTDQIIARQISDGNQYYFISKGLLDYEQERQLIRDRSCFLNSRIQFLGTMPQVVSRWGFNPWRPSPVVLFPFHSSLVTQKNGPFNNELRRVMMWFPDSGLVEHYTSRYIAHKYLNPPKEEELPPSPLTILHFTGPLILLIVLLTVANLMFIAEILIK